MTASAPGRVPWPPILYLLGVLAAVLLNTLLPLPWIGQPMSDLLFVIGLILIAGAIVIDVSAALTLRLVLVRLLACQAPRHPRALHSRPWVRHPLRCRCRCRCPDR